MFPISFYITYLLTKWSTATNLLMHPLGVEDEAPLHKKKSTLQIRPLGPMIFFLTMLYA